MAPYDSSVVTGPFLRQPNKENYMLIRFKYYNRYYSNQGKGEIKDYSCLRSAYSTPLPIFGLVSYSYKKRNSVDSCVFRVSTFKPT
jgi:hypothetical protein